MIRSLTKGGVPDAPLGQGDRVRPRLDLRPVAFLSVGFVASASLAFAVAFGVGRAFGVLLVPAAVRLLAAVVLCAGLLTADVAALRAKTLCRIGFRRQTPKNLIYRYGPHRGPLLWGLDTGLAVTTFRVSAATWALLALLVLQLVPWWIGVAFGMGFVASQLVVVVLPRWRHAAADGTPREPHWITTHLMRRRWVGQVAALVALAGVIASLMVQLASGR
jgi:hypothetical protein